MAKRRARKTVRSYDSILRTTLDGEDAGTRRPFDFSGRFSKGGDNWAMDAEMHKRAEGILESARRDYEDWGDYRARRIESVDQERGRHWETKITDPDNENETITEKELIERRGRIAFVINQMASIHRNLKGQYRQNTSDRIAFPVSEEAPSETEMLNTALRSVRRYNRTPVLEADLVGELIRSGLFISRVDIDFDSTLGRDEVTVESVHPARFFMNLDIQDRRLKGLRRIGQLHDYTMEQLISIFAVDENGHYDSAKGREIRKAYPDAEDQYSAGRTRGRGNRWYQNIDFLQAQDLNFQRVIEVWNLEHEEITYVHDPETQRYYEPEETEAELAEINADREKANAAAPDDKQMELLRLYTRYEPVWYVYFFTPDGDILYSERSSYWHEGHPFVPGLANFLDGEVWGLFETIWPQQRWLNRLVAMVDHSITTTAKGVLVVDRRALGDDMPDDVVIREWSKPDGVIFVEPMPGAKLPEQITRNAVPADVFAILQMLRQWTEETSGATGAVRGEEPVAGTPAASLNMQISQASLTNQEWFEAAFEAFHEMDLKIISCIMQAYTERRRIVPDAAGSPVVEYKPEDVQQIDWEVSVGNVQQTPTQQLAWEADMQQWLNTGFLSFGDYLEYSRRPGAKVLHNHLRQQNPELLQRDIADIGVKTGEILPSIANGAAQ